MPKSKLIKPSELDLSNRKLLAAAQKVGLSTDEIIRKSLQAAHGKMLKRGGGRPKSAASGKNHDHNPNLGVVKRAGNQSAPPPQVRGDGNQGGSAVVRKPRR
jgi:hypothetical protein